MGKNRCHYCGGEIEDGVLKCKHCGEWLVPPEERPQYPNETQSDYVVEYKDKTENKHGIGCIITVIVVLVFLVVTAVTSPSENEHRQEIKSSIAEYARGEASKKLQDKESLSAFVGSLMLSSDALVQAFVDQYCTIDIKNYGVFSLGYLQIANEDKPKLVSIGALGRIFFLLDYKDIAKEKHKSTNNNGDKDA